MSRRPNRTVRPSRRASARPMTVEALEVRELLTGYMVTTNADSGTGSLRAAILKANTDGNIGGDTIEFALGSGVHTIALQSSLPTVTQTVSIIAPTGSNHVPQVVIDGSNAGLGANGLTFSGGGSTVQGLSIVGFQTNAGNGGAGIYLTGSGGDSVIDDYVGILPDGATARANSSGIVVASPRNTIGGTVAGDSDLISGNTNAGLLITGAGATGNVVRGDFIGTDSTGNTGVGNTYGVVLSASNNTIGGANPGEGNVISGNLGPLGNTGVGVLFEGTSTGNIVAGNKIGTNAAGTAAVTTAFSGVTIGGNVYGVYFGNPSGTGTDNVSGDQIGAAFPGAGNLISGNYIGIAGNGTSLLVAGNTIGLNASGSAAIPNGDGILLGANLSTIGGATSSARNVISGNNDGGLNAGTNGYGLSLTGTADVIQGNYVGLTASGAGGSGVGNMIGMDLDLVGSTIGGSTAAAANVVANNSGDGIQLAGEGGVAILGNYIGTNSARANLGNGGSGIDLTIANPGGTITSPLALNDSIGGTAAGAGNTIAFNNGAAVGVHNMYPAGVTGLGIRGNAMGANKIGIDLAGDGVPGVSTLFINGALNSNTVPNQTTVQGVYFAEANQPVSIDIFSSTNDPSGYGQGSTYLGTVSGVTNSSGFFVFSPTYKTSATAFTATATGSDGNTQEFSENFPTPSKLPQANLVVTSTPSATTVAMGGQVKFTETVTNKGPNAANNVQLTDLLPASYVNAAIASSVGSATIKPGNIALVNIGTLASGQSATVTITGNASAMGVLQDNPGASSTTYDPDYSNNFSVSDRVAVTQGPSTAADLAITGLASNPTPGVGNTETYTLNVKNNGPAVATNVTVNDFLPSTVKFVKFSWSQGNGAGRNGTFIQDNLGTIAAGGSATLTIVVTISATGSIVNAANVSGNQYDPASGNNSTSITVTAS